MEAGIKGGIECKTGVCGGKPVISGTRISVEIIATEYAYLGRTPEEIVCTHPHLELAQVHDALAYYFRHKAEIDRDIAEEHDIIRQVAVQYGIPNPA